MKLLRMLTVLAIVLSLPLAAAEKTKVTIDVSGLFLTRGAGATDPLVSLSANQGTGDIFTTDSVALTAWKPGGDLRLGLSWGKLGAEVRGFMLSKWTNSALYAFTAFSSLAIETNPTTMYGISADDTLTASNESTFKGFEANLTYQLSPAVLVYAGARYLLIDETFDLLGDFGGGSTEEDIWNTKNKMLGGQVGARVDFVRLADEAKKGLTVQGYGAFALFSNSAHADFTVVGHYDIIPADGSKISPAVDAGVQIGYRIGGMIEVHAGYGLMWLNSVVQGTRQVAGTTSYNSEPTLDLVFCSLMVHGAKAGLTIRF